MTRALPQPEAARYVGCKDVAQFMREVRAGVWPAALPIASRPPRWDKAALDAKMNEYSGIEDADGEEQAALEALRRRRGQPVRPEAA